MSHATHTESKPSTPKPPTFFERNEFLLRRLHSLSGLIPVGAYMCVHLLTNATVLDSPATFQGNVYKIHALGKILPIVEWAFIFIPILFHAIFGMIIIRSGVSNTGKYQTGANIRYMLQRITGMLAFAFIMWHVFHMHGWFHNESWVEMAEGVGGAKFKAYNATSTAAAALSANLIVPLLYAIGILSCVFHLANGIWTMGITWGLWVSPAAQARANWISIAFGLGLSVVGLSALTGMRNVDIDAARQVEDTMYNSKVASGELQPNEHKRVHEEHAAEAEGHEAASHDEAINR